jgi:NAD(P)-dependent dehydrogenase (short-subunit alcohol dehydrogenase family)
MAAAPTLTGRVALVTGASRGIGRAIAQRLAAHGATLVVTASERSEADLHETCARIRAAGGRAEPLLADLADEAQRSDLVERARAQCGDIDILINNAAAITAYAPPSRIDLAARQAMFAINVDAPIDLIQQALPVMRKRAWGRIINISSDTVRQPPLPYPGPAKFVHALTAYGASKAALDRYTLGLAAELHNSGICVNALLPYRIARTEGAAAVAERMQATHPDWIEPVESMAEAAYQLITTGCTGTLAISRELLHRLQAPVLALDGESPLGDAATLFTPK